MPMSQSCHCRAENSGMSDFLNLGYVTNFFKFETSLILVVASTGIERSRKATE
jgi:hypothetical protein